MFTIANERRKDKYYNCKQILQQHFPAETWNVFSVCEEHITKESFHFFPNGTIVPEMMMMSPTTCCVRVHTPVVCAGVFSRKLIL